MNSVQIGGMDVLLKKLKSVSDNADSIVEKGLLKAGHKVRNRAVLLAPVDTGALRNSIQVEKPAPLSVTVGTNIEYAPYVEYGTGTQGDPSVAHTSKEQWSYQDEDGQWHTVHGQSAQPFLRPAVIPEEINDTVREEIERGIANAGR